MKSFNHQFAALGLACAFAVLAACGGGGGSTPTPTPAPTPAPVTPPTPAPVVTGNPSVDGTVTGFGSIIVDGNHFDTHGVLAVRELEDGSFRPFEVKLGHHLSIEHDGNRVASKVHGKPDVEGPVSAVGAATLVVLGQTVAVNIDAARGPLTVFGAPYTKLADVLVGDLVEVHGSIKIDAGASVLQATRIEKKEAGDAHHRGHGVISALNATARTFKLNDLSIDYTDAKLLPNGVVLANGSEVHVSIPVGTISSGVAVKAKLVRVVTRKAASEGKPAELGGPLTALDANAKSFTVNGVLVDASSATFNQAGRTFADLKVGSYVVVKGGYLTDTSMKATTIVLRGAGGESDGAAELKGSISDFVSAASFSVRDVQVDASGATLDPSSCVLANDLDVRVQGAMTAAGKVLATSVRCDKVRDAKTVVTRSGTASATNAAAKTFTLAARDGNLSVQWSAVTNFVKADPAGLDGNDLVVHGIMAGTVLQAEKIVQKGK